MATSASKAASKSGQKQENGDAPPPDKSKKMLLILVAVLVLLIAGGGGAYFFQARNATSKEEKTPPPIFLVMDTFTVNLQQQDDIQQYLQVGMTLQVADQAQVDLIKLYMPQVRSRLLTLLSSKKASELMSPEGKKKLTAEILAQVKQPFSPKGPEANVSDVFFTSFVVQ